VIETREKGDRDEGKRRSRRGKRRYRQGAKEMEMKNKRRSRLFGSEGVGGYFCAFLFFEKKTTAAHNFFRNKWPRSGGLFLTAPYFLNNYCALLFLKKPLKNKVATTIWGKNLTPILKVLVGGILFSSSPHFDCFEDKPK